VVLPITFPNGEVIEAGINIRPHAKEILQHLSQHFEVIVFTASHACYANVVLDHLDPDQQLVHHRLYRDHCYATPEGMHVKDLRVIDRALSDMVLIDNAAYSYIHQLDNGIPILPFYHGASDFELRALQTYLDSLMLAKDVRAVNRKTFKLHLYNKYYDDLEKLV
jgi:CTD small phosphatase-like protein 2